MNTGNLRRVAPLHRHIMAFLMRGRGLTLRQIGEILGGVSPNRAMQLSEIGRRHLVMIAFKLNRGDRMTDLEKEMLTGAELSYELGRKLPLVNGRALQGGVNHALGNRRRTLLGQGQQD